VGLDVTFCLQAIKGGVDSPDGHLTVGAPFKAPDEGEAFCHALECPVGAAHGRVIEFSCRFSVIRTIFLKKYNFARSRACLVGTKTMGFSRRRRLMQGEIRDY
jgi:hypothetical protein